MDELHTIDSSSADASTTTFLSGASPASENHVANPEHSFRSVSAATTATSTSTAPREHFIGTAITFLQNPGVKRNPLNQKQQFLRSKGLTESEIQIACDRAGVFTGDSAAGTSGRSAAAGSSSSTLIQMDISSGSETGGGSKFMHHHHRHHRGASAASLTIGPAKSLLQYVREVVSTSALVAGVAYALYVFYRKYVRPWLFGRDDSGRDGGSLGGGGAAARKRRRKTPEELMEDMSRSVEKSVASINQELVRVKEELARNARQESLHNEISGFKTDLEAIKGLLLSRKQFTTPNAAPTIPSWQLELQPKATQPSRIASITTGASGAISVSALNDDDITSGSSETEVVNKNSDSSIEMI